MEIKERAKIITSSVMRCRSSIKYEHLDKISPDKSCKVKAIASQYNDLIICTEGLKQLDELRKTTSNAEDIEDITNYTKMILNTLSERVTKRINSMD